MPRPKKNKQAGDAFKNLLKEKGFSQRRLAKETGLDGGLISKIATGETAEPKTTTLEKVASVLGVDLTELIKIFTQPTVRSHSSLPAENLLLPQADIEAKAAFESPEFLSSDCAIASSPSEDIEALVQKVRSHFNETIQDEYANLCTFNPRFNRPMRLGKLSTMYVQTELNESDDYDSSGFSQERQSWKKVVLEKPQLMVLGKPGAGKTTLLHYIALHCDEIEFNPKLVPVFISLKTLAENVKHPDEIDILRYIQKEYCGSNISEQEIKYLLDRGRILLLLDGLDEVSDEKVGTLIEKINSLIPRLVDKRFIVSCRKESRAYISNKLFKFFLCKVANFEEQQITEFINNWFSQSRVGTSQEREALANKLDTKLKDQQNKRIRELADTPLLLHLICLIFQENRDLPSKKVDIYKQGINLLLEKWNQFNYRTQVNVEELRKALRGIAAITFENGKSFFEEGEVLRSIDHCPIKLSDIEVSSGLLVNKGGTYMLFPIKLFKNI
ncbi:NACHT domain-containing protein [Microcoleus sp. N9_A1]|uniref:NACHT domain-containing protein n=1 Tax=Microcoleus sp. N9_A1 TaxID=3055380 RepID=UPI002FD046C9